MPARAITKVIGEILLADAEAERSFELVPQSRVVLGVIECLAAPEGQGKDENLFSGSQLDEKYNLGKVLLPLLLKFKNISVSVCLPKSATH